MNRLSTPHTAVLARRGATLTEVLMSLLVMGLGITSVFTLFPMSVLRSIKATNLTHAALLAESARDMYVFRKNIVSRQPSRSTTPYYYGYPKDYFLADAGGPVADTAIPEAFAGTFVVDPYGGVNADEFGNQKGRFGYPTGGVLRTLNQLPVPTTDGTVQLDPYSSLDSWVTSVEQVPLGIQNLTVAGTQVTQLEFGTEIDLSTSVSPTQSRALLMSTDNRQSYTRTLHSTPVPAGNNNYLHIVPQIPAADHPSIGNVRVQNFERRYTFLYTLHFDESGESFGQTVVYFRREFGESERMYKVKDNTIDRLNRRLTVQLGAGFAGRAPSGGDYIFGTWRAKTPPAPGSNVVHGRWYRIVSVAELPAGSWAVPGEPEYRLTLDRNWEGLWHPNNQPFVMLPGGVVGVFDL